MSAFPTDRAVRMPTARSEIVGAHHDRSTGDLAPAPDMVGGREARDPSIFIIICKACEAADLAKAAGVEQQIDPFTAGKLAAIALADHARILRVRREAAMGDRLQCLHVGKQRGPRVIAIVGRRGCIAAAHSWRDGGDNLAGHNCGSDLDGPDIGHDPGTRSRDRSFHLHGADDHQRCAALDRGADLCGELDDRARHRALNAFLAAWHSQAVRCRLCAGQGEHAMAAMQRRRLLLEQRQRARGGRRCMGRCSEVRVLGEKTGPSIARPYYRVREDRAQLPKIGRQAGDVKLIQSAQSVLECRRVRMR